MFAWLRYHWVVRRRARRLLRDHVESLPASASGDDVIDVIDVTDRPDVRAPSRARTS